MSFQIFVNADATRSFIIGLNTGNPTLHEALIILSKTFSIIQKKKIVFIIIIIPTEFNRYSYLKYILNALKSK